MPHTPLRQRLTRLGVLMLLCPLLFLTACASTRVVTEPVYIELCDVSDLAPVEVPALTGDTNRDVWSLAVRSRAALDEANARIGAAQATCAPLP